MAEHEIQNQIIAHLREAGYLVIRINSGRKANVPFCYWYEPFGAYLPEAGAAIKLTDYLKLVGNTTKQDGKNTKGVSDLLAFKPGIVLVAEIKQPGGKLRDDQRRFLAAAEQSGITAITTDGLDDFITQLKQLDAEKYL